jgi:hypothetical protein
MSCRSLGTLGSMKEPEAQRRRSAITAFADALRQLLEVSDVRQPDPFGFNYGYEPYVMPQRGMESEWSRRRNAVDLAAPKAGLAFQATGVGIAWKPPGYAPGTSLPVNPATEWASVLDTDPKFGLDVLQQVINQALGTLDALVEEESHRSRERSPRTRGGVPKSAGRAKRGGFTATEWVFTIVGLVVAGLIVAYLAYRFGWVGGSSK